MNDLDIVKDSIQLAADTVVSLPLTDEEVEELMAKVELLTTNIMTSGEAL